MAVYKRGKTWWYNFVFDGRRVQASTKVKNKNDARDIERAAWNRLARHEVGLPAKGEKKTPPTIAELLDRLEADFKRGKRRGKWSFRTASNFKIARAAFPASMKAESLTSDDLNKYIDKKQKQHRAPATINRAIGLIASAFKLSDVRGPKFSPLPEEGNTRTGFFEADESARLLEHLPEDLKDFCRFAYTTGWRKNEIASLTWYDIEGDVVRLRGEHSKNSEARSIVLTGELREIIERRKAARLANGVLTNLVFHRDGRAVAEFRKAWATACKNAGLVGKLFHDFRRTAVRDMVRGGVLQNVAMKISGHKTASMFRRYDICNEDDLRQASEAVERYRAAVKQKVVQMESSR